MSLTDLLILTGCGSTQYLVPPMTPVKPRLSQPVRCGHVHYIKKDGKVILDAKDAACLKAQIKQCCLDRKKLIVANEANIKQMEAVSHEQD